MSESMDEPRRFPLVSNVATQAPAASTAPGTSSEAAAGLPTTSEAIAPSYGRALFVASTGGHLEQLSRLEPRFFPGFEQVHYATFDDAQSRSLLAGRNVHVVPRIAPRGLKAAMQTLAPARRILQSGAYDTVVSTGSAIAVPFAMAARSLGLPVHYVESSARSQGPSLTGKILSAVPGIHLYTQYHAWSTSRWHHRGSVFDGFDFEPHGDPRRPIRRVVVTLGTMRGYPFRRAVDAARAQLSSLAVADADILWQVGDTPMTDLDIDGFNLLPAQTMNEAIEAADLVIGHAGIGTCLQMLDRGHCPVLLPRSLSHREHVDNHQWLIADELDARGLAVSRDPDALTADDVRLAMSRRVVRPAVAAPFELVGRNVHR